MKIFKYLIYLLLVLFVGGCFVFKMLSEAEPDGKGGTQADELAMAVMEGLNKTAFEAIPYLQWEFFRGGHKYFWDKKNNRALIEWGDNKVIMNLDS